MGTRVWGGQWGMGGWVVGYRVGYGLYWPVLAVLASLALYWPLWPCIGLTGPVLASLTRYWPY